MVDALSYYLWAIGAVLFGLGIWGLATAVVVRAIAGTATMLAIGPLGLTRPRWSWSHVRPLLRFGMGFQATTVLVIVREQGLNVVVAAVAGISTLGVWNLAWRVLQIPNLLFLTSARVAFPAMSRLLGGGRNPRPFIERGVAAVGVLSGFVVVGLVAFAPALPSLVGNAWRDVPAVLLWSGVALIVGMPITVATSGYLLAGNRVGTVATAMLASAVVWFGVAVLLLPRYGAPAVGVGWVIAALINAGLLWRRTAASTGAAIGRHAAGPTAVSLVAAIVSWLMARHIGPQLAGAVVALTVGELILLAGLATVSASALRDTHSLAREGIRSFRQSGVSHMRTSAAPRPTSSNLDVGPGARSSSAARDGGGPDP